MIERRFEVPPVPAVTVELASSFQPPADGFLRLHAERLRLRASDGQLSAQFDYFRVARPALDAVVIAAYFVDEGSGESENPWVILRSAVRPPVALRAQEDARRGENQTTARAENGGSFATAVRPEHGLWELPAGLIEPSEANGGERLAAARELREETGLLVAPQDFQSLGPVSYPCAGVIGERQTFFSIEVSPEAAGSPELDGSVLEQAGRVIAVPLAVALRAARRGQLGDMKSELALRRLADKWGTA